jgi:hypothetical protein
MLPESAWTLKRGERIIGRSPDSGKLVPGLVAAVHKWGSSIKDYMDCGYDEMTAHARQFDGPTVVMLCDGGGYTEWRPDYVERVTDDFVIKCCLCGAVVRVKLPLRSFHLMAAGEPYYVSLADQPLVHQAMILQSKCGTHADLRHPVSSDAVE